MVRTRDRRVLGRHLQGLGCLEATTRQDLQERALRVADRDRGHERLRAAWRSVRVAVLWLGWLLRTKLFVILRLGMNFEENVQCTWIVSPVHDQ